MPKFKNDRIGFKLPSSLKDDLTLLAEYNKRSLSNFITFELEKVINMKENQETLKKIKENKEKET